MLLGKDTCTTLPLLAEPREKGGLYWGYVTRLAHSLQDMMESCPFPGAVASAAPVCTICCSYVPV